MLDSDGTVDPSTGPASWVLIVSVTVAMMYEKEGECLRLCLQLDGQ